jgi:hypothetical protein
MTFLTRLVLFMGLCVALGAGLTQGCADWLDLTDWAQRIEHERQRREELDEWDRILLGHLAGKEKALTELLEGKKTLLQTAAAFAAIDDSSPPHFRLESDRFFPGATRGERLCRQVIQWCDTELFDHPAEEVQPILERLERELRNHLQQYGTVEVMPQ